VSEVNHVGTVLDQGDSGMPLVTQGIDQSTLVFPAESPPDQLPDHRMGGGRFGPDDQAHVSCPDKSSSSLTRVRTWQSRFLLPSSPQ
jgi:hypothetical protein